MKRRGWWHVPAMLVLAAILCVALLVVELQDREEKEKMDELKSRASELETEMDRLLSLRDKGERDCTEECRPKAAEQLLFPDLDARIYSLAYPMLRDADIPGNLGLSVNALPGDPDKLSREQFDELLAAGWGCCLICTDAEDLARWDGEISALLQARGLSKPDAVYFPEGSFRAELKEELIGLGYHVAIHHGENGTPLIPVEPEGTLLLPGAYPYNFDGVKGVIRQIVQRGGEHCFVLSFSESGSLFQESTVSNMLAFLQPFLEQDQLEVTDFARGYALHDPLQNGAAERRAAWEVERAALTERIYELRKQIGEIYDAWKGN